jgi:leucyl aminopeptidase
MPPCFAAPTDPALPLVALDPSGLEGWRETADPRMVQWVAATGFAAGAGEICLLPDADGGLAGALFGLGEGPGRFAIAGAAAKLPERVWRLDGVEGVAARQEAALAWLLAGYRFTRYRDRPAMQARLIAPEGVDADRIAAIAAGEFLTRDLINTPANDMGPAALETAVRALAADFGAAVEVTAGAALLTANLPLIHAVGRAGAEAPRLIDMVWGDPADPALTLVGKGVCFDTGGLNLKPGSSMGLMKKDMGGAATVLGLAHMLMATAAPVRLRVLIPAVENAVAGNAFRPGDILTARNGLTVEVNNTDAEGRLVLADALALADEDPPAALVCMATLTGAARVALGPDLAPFYTDDDTLAGQLAAAAARVGDPLWRMPFWDGYEARLDPGIADLDNAPKGGMAGSILAALFLRRFVRASPRFVHFDIYGWSPDGDAARPRGGIGQGARALFEALPGLLGP